MRKLRHTIEQFVPDGFRDEDGVWHDGPHRAAALAELDALLACAEALRDAGSELEAGNDRGAKHIIQDALAALDGEQT